MRYAIAAYMQLLGCEMVLAAHASIARLMLAVTSSKKRANSALAQYTEIQHGVSVLCFNCRQARRGCRGPRQARY